MLQKQEWLRGRNVHSDMGKRAGDRKMRDTDSREIETMGPWLERRLGGVGGLDPGLRAAGECEGGLGGVGLDTPCPCQEACGTCHPQHTEPCPQHPVPPELENLLAGGVS